MIPFNFITVCWGQAYCDTCVEDMLPTLLSEGNLTDPSLAGRARFFFYTTPADFKRLESSPAVQRLKHLMEVLPLDVTQVMSELMGPGSDPSAKYSVMNACHRHATEQGNQEKAAVVYLSPDHVFSNGVCRRLVELADAGKMAVLVAAQRITQEGYRRGAAQLWGDRAPAFPGLKPRELVEIALRCFTQYTHSLFWDSPEIGVQPNQLFWKVDDTSYILRGFHLHPLMVRPEIQGTLPIGTTDGHFLEYACPRRDLYHFIDDSDDFCAYTIGPYDELAAFQVQGRYSEESLGVYILWRIEDIGMQHLLVVRKTFRFHTRDLDASWTPVEAESNRVLAGILCNLTQLQKRMLTGAQWEPIYRQLLQPKNPSAS